MGMLSYDKARKQIVLRQFHVESFVTTYRMQPPVEGRRRWCSRAEL